MSGTGVNPEPPPLDPVAERPPSPWPASPPPAITPAARTAIRFAIVVIAALVVVGAVGGLGAVSFALATSRVVMDTQELPAGTRSLIIDTGGVAVPVRIVADADATKPRVDLRMVTRTDDTQLSIVSEGTRSQVTLGAGGSAFVWLVGTGMNVVLPPNVARELSVTVNHRTGSLTSDADLDQLVVRSDIGAVALSGSARSIDIDVHRGDISTATRIAVTESFSAVTEEGSISVEFRAAPRRTEAIASGNVTVGLPSLGAYRVRAGSEAPTGSTTVTVPETTDPSAPRVTVRSENGNVSVNEVR
ncbi:hypothetical protein [Mycobacterium neumannii]|uniref:hypothetical protein n=1 Tax=Mycobacterium neumannii TaxID=2048551 RepID=UPI003AB8DA3F